MWDNGIVDTAVTLSSDRRSTWKLKTFVPDGFEGIFLSSGSCHLIPAKIAKQCICLCDKKHPNMPKQLQNLLLSAMLLPDSSLAASLITFLLLLFCQLFLFLLNSMVKSSLHTLWNSVPCQQYLFEDILP